MYIVHIDSYCAVTTVFDVLLFGLLFPPDPFTIVTVRFCDGMITPWHPPYEKANEVATYLKKNQNCDLVICLSHLGFKRQSDEIDNHKFAIESENIDVIISGDDDLVINTLAVVKNKRKDEVFVSNAGWGGLTMGELRYTFDILSKRNEFGYNQYIPGLSDNKTKKEIYQELIA